MTKQKSECEVVEQHPLRQIFDEALEGEEGSQTLFSDDEIEEIATALGVEPKDKK